jgi:Flp pilus assembly protein TadG
VPTSHGRRGHLAFELLLVLPLLLAFVMGVVEFSMMLTVRQQLLAASREAARAAAQGADDQEVQDTVKRSLGSGRVAQAAQVSIRHVPEDPNNPTAGRDRVEVVVHTPTTAVVPNFLAWVGVNMNNREMVAGTVMNKE